MRPPGSLAVLVSRHWRDWRAALALFTVTLVVFGLLWGSIIKRSLEQLSPFFRLLAGQSGLGLTDLEGMVFDGPGKMVRTLIGGDRVSLDKAMDILSIVLVHPLTQVLIAFWAVGRGASALAGELERGTLELLLSQPVSRPKVAFSHAVFDLASWVLISVAFTSAAAAGAWWVSPLRERPLPAQLQAKLDQAKWWNWSPASLFRPAPLAKPESDRLKIEPERFLLAAPAVAALGWSVSGIAFAASAFGRSRMRVLGLVALMMALMFLINLLGQLWEPLLVLRPLTVFYYYLPQEAMLGGTALVDWAEWLGPGAAAFPGFWVLVATGALGYLTGTFRFSTRDLPAPL